MAGGSRRRNGDAARRCSKPSSHGGSYPSTSPSSRFAWKVVTLWELRPAPGPTRNIWFTLSSSNIGMINPSDPGAGIAQYTTPTYDSDPGPIGDGPDGNYWFFETRFNQFGVINPTTDHITEVPLPTAVAIVGGITAGPKGTVWFTALNTNQIGVINTATDQVSFFPVITPGAQPSGIVEGPDGNIRFTEGRNGVWSRKPSATFDPFDSAPSSPGTHAKGNSGAERS